jgi:hypothetical protein
MESIKRSDIYEQWAHSGIVEAGDFAFISYCVGNIGLLFHQLDTIAYKGNSK